MAYSYSTVLRGWKEISAYLGISVRTARRWETVFGLPVQRLGPAASVFCYPDELDLWLRRTDARAKPYVRPAWIIVEPLGPGSASRTLTLDQTRFKVLTARGCSEAISIAKRVAVEGLLVVADLAQSDIRQLCDLFRSAHPTKPIVIAAGSTVGKPFTPLKIALTEHPRGTQGRRIDISVLIDSEVFGAG